MPIPQHTLNIYQKPLLGSSFVRRLPVYNYRHEISAIGGFDNASFDIALGSISEMQGFLDQYIGNRVAIFVDNPVEPVWEGFINRMTFAAGEVQYSISLDEMANRVTITFTNPTASATDAQITAQGQNTDSQAIYGIKWANVDGVYRRGGNGATALRDTILASRAWPLSSIVRGYGNGLLQVECLGFYHTLSWDIYQNASTAASNLNAMVNSVRSGLANGTTFFDNADTTEVSANTTGINVEHVKRETAWDTLVRFQEMGDGGAPWVIGITPTLFETGTRRLYYRAANLNAEYTARQADGLRIRNLYGQIVDPWRVRPDRVVRVSDQLIGWSGLGFNPTETWIKTLEYDANRQTVEYHGEDDLTNRGVFQLGRYGKPVGQKFGAPRRLT